MSKSLSITYDEIIENSIDKITIILKGQYVLSKRSIALLLLQEAEYMARKADKKVMADHKKDMKKFYNSVKSIKNR